MRNALALVVSLAIGHQALAYDPSQPENTSHVAMLERAKGYVAQANYADAIFELNSILLLPVNASTEPAQLLLIDSLITSGSVEKAKVEANYYLATFADNKNAQQVREKLIGLEIYTMVPPSTGKLQPRKLRTGTQSSTDGCVSVYYHGGEQNLLSTSIKFSGSELRDQYTYKYAARYTQLKNLVNKQGDQQQLNQFWVSANDTYNQYEIRVGRMNPVVGVISRFDGVVLKQDVLTDKRWYLAAGTPYMPGQSHRQFATAGLEYNLGEFSVTSYVSQQNTSGMVERTALGSEARYFKDSTAVLMSGEYDFVYNKFNYFTTQLTKKFADYDVYALYDKRKSPLLLLNRSNILLTKPEQVDYTIATTGTAQTAVVGASKTIYNTMVYLDLQSTNIGSTSAVYDQPFIAGTSTNSINLQLTPKFLNRTSFLASYAHTQKYMAVVKDFNYENIRYNVIARWDINSIGNQLIVTTKAVQQVQAGTTIEAQLSVVKGNAGFSNSFFIGVNNDL